MKTVYITPRAQSSLESILAYMLEHWSVKEHNRFLDVIIKTTYFIQLYPRLFPIYSNRIRKAVINRQIAMFYMEKRDRIDIYYSFGICVKILEN